MEYVTFEELYDAERICRKHKSKSKACIEYEMHLLTNLSNLLERLNTMTYEIGVSICFCVTRPKLREVFAGDYEDRIVQTLFVMKFGSTFDEYEMYDCYACRKGKGTQFGVERLREQINEAVKKHGTENVWIWKGDIEACFMSIDRMMLADMAEKFIRWKYSEWDVDWWIWLMRMMITHAPEHNCQFRGDIRLFDGLTPMKSLHKNGEGKGLAIGNLIAQLMNNFLLSVLDYFLWGFMIVMGFGRYADDFYVIGKKEDLLWLMGETREFLKKSIGMTLHPKKWELQHWTKGVKFAGSVVKCGRVYTGNRVVNGLFGVKCKYDTEKFAARVNSYYGFMSHTNSYGIRRRFWSSLPIEVQRKIYATERFCVIKVRNNYKSNLYGI